MQNTAVKIIFGLIVFVWSTNITIAQEDKEFQKIIDSYFFIDDFSMKPGERPVSDELFWKYKFKLPKISFPILFDLPNIERTLPRTDGAGMAYQHLNRGRKLFLEGKYDQARATWLTGRARFGKDYPHHRRNDFFIGLAYLQLAKQELEAKKGDYNDATVKSNFDNAATFLSWAYTLKEEIPDEVVEYEAPQFHYNLAAIYWRYNRFAGAYGAAEKGLNYLRKSGRKDHRALFHRIISEAYIKNRSYLQAIQELDIGIRQDRDPSQASAMFARAGDIYFDLNNYETAEVAYRNGAAIEEEMDQINPAQLILRGESLFWLGKFSEAQKMLYFGLEGPSYRKLTSDLPYDMASKAALRIADAYLALGQDDKAKLEYYKVGHRYRNTLAGRIAKVREACLELPSIPANYKGKNVKHMRKLLEEAKVDTLPTLAKELAWACKVQSYSDRERTPAMLERVRKFASSHPKSRFLKNFVDPVREVQASRIYDYFKNGDLYNAVAFFETNRDLLFKTVPDDLKSRLFSAYVDLFQTEKAMEFWSSFKNQNGQGSLIRKAVAVSEMSDENKAWSESNSKVAKNLRDIKWTITPETVHSRAVTRILSTKEAPKHYQWINNLGAKWAKDDSRYICDLQYPMLSRRLIAGEDKSELNRELQDLIGTLLPDMLKTDQACALSLLDLEVKLFADDLRPVADNYLNRKSWPLRGTYLSMFWTLSEKLEQQKHNEKARDLWVYLQKNGPVGSKEVRFARARLDPTKTETENLWNN